MTPVPRENFPLLDRRIEGSPIVYLDSAATSLTPAAVLRAQYDYSAGIGANVHRGHHTLAVEGTAAFNDARRTVAAFMGADPDCVVFCGGATEALNMIASGLPLSPNDVVLVPESEHHSNLLPWMRRATVRRLTHDPRWPIDEDALKAALGELRPKLVTFSHASNTTGVINGAERLCRLCREHGALTVVDASQSAPHIPIDVEALGCDFLVFSGHKMLGPFGVGVLWGRRALLANLTPLCEGGGSVDGMDGERFTPAAVPARLEPGTRNVSGIVALAVAVKYLSAPGWAAVRRHEEELADQLDEELSAIPGVTLVMARSRPRLALALFVLASTALRPAEIATALSLSHNIMVRSGQICAMPLMARLGLTDGAVRASAYVYNRADEITALARAVRTMSGRFGHRVG